MPRQVILNGDPLQAVIVKARTKLDLTGEEVCTKLFGANTSRQYYFQLETGNPNHPDKSQAPNPETLKGLSKILGVKYSVLVEATLLRIGVRTRHKYLKN